MTMRLSASSLAGTARTLVAVGTVSETFMFLTTLAAAPRSGLCLPAATGVAALPAAGLSAAGFSAGFSAGGGRGGGRSARRRGFGRGWPASGGVGLRLRRGAGRCRRRRCSAGGARAVARHPRGCPAGSRRRTRARPGRRSTGRRGTAGTSPRPATRWCRIPPPPRSRRSSWRTAGRSSRLTRGRVPSSSMGRSVHGRCAQRDVCAPHARWAGLDRVSSLRPTLRGRPGMSVSLGGAPTVMRGARSVGRAVGDEHLGQRVVGRGPTRVPRGGAGPRRPG